MPETRLHPRTGLYVINCIGRRADPAAFLAREISGYVYDLATGLIPIPAG